MVFAAIQSGVLSVVLFWAMWFVLGRVAPMVRARWQQALALWLMRENQPRWLSRLGLRLLPRVEQHCGVGCADCGTCA